MNTDPKDTISIKLIHNWRKAWTFYSMRLIALGVLAQSTVAAADATGLSAHLHPWFLSALSYFAIACGLAAGVGRIIKQPDKP